MAVRTQGAAHQPLAGRSRATIRRTESPSRSEEGNGGNCSLNAKHSPPGDRPAWFRYAAAAAAVGLAATLNLAARRYLTDAAPAAFFPTAIVLAAVAGGYRAGLLAVALAGLVRLVVLDPPTLPRDGLRLAVFV